MKRFIIIAISIIASVFSASAQISQSERDQLSTEQRAAYDRQYKELTQVIQNAERDIFRAEEIIKMGEEMKRDNGGVAGAAHAARGMELKEKAEKAKKEAEKGLRLLDEAARKAIKNNKKK